MCQNVHRVCDEDQDGVCANWLHSFENLLQHLDISTNQIQSRIAGSLFSAGTDDDDVTLASVLVMALFDPDIGQVFCVRKILHLGVTDFWIDIN
jgi:hypothetical protein